MRIEEELNSAASEHIPLWKSSKCFSKPPTLVFLLKFPENPPSCCMCFYFVQFLYKGRTFCYELFSIQPRHAEGPSGGCAPGPGRRGSLAVPRTSRGPAALQTPCEQSSAPCRDTLNCSAQLNSEHHLHPTSASRCLPLSHLHYFFK